jgi:hypothetical protein
MVFLKSASVPEYYASFRNKNMWCDKVHDNYQILMMVPKHAGLVHFFQGKFTASDYPFGIFKLFWQKLFVIKWANYSHTPRLMS